MLARLEAGALGPKVSFGKQRMLMVTLAWSTADVFDDVNNLLISAARQTLLSTEPSDLLVDPADTLLRQEIWLEFDTTLKWFVVD